MKNNDNRTKKIGLIVNPIAGMGGSVGLKGTDGNIYKKALKMGAEPIAPNRVNQLLSFIKNIDKIKLIVAPGNMGADFFRRKKIPALSL